MPLLSSGAVAAPEDTTAEANSNRAAADAAAPQDARSPAALGSLLDSAQGTADRDRLYGNVDKTNGGSLPPIVSAVRSPRFAGQPAEVTDLRAGSIDIEIVPADEFVAQQTATPAGIAEADRESTAEITAENTERLTLEDLRSLIENDAALQESTAPSEQSTAEQAVDQAAADQVAQEAQEAPAADDSELPTLSEPALEEATPEVTEPADTAPAGEAAPEAPATPTESQTPESQPSETDPSTPPQLSSPAPSNSSQAELSDLPDILLTDPNPLATPTFPEEVDLDQIEVITLEQAVDLAYRNNQALQRSLLTLEQSEAVVREANAARLPSVTVNSDLLNQSTDGNSTTTLGADVRVDYNLLSGGQRGASIRAAELQRDVSALAVEAQQEQTRLVTANLYYALQESGEQIRINQSFVNEAERNLRDARLRQEVGVGTRFDVLRAEVQFANARQSLIQSRSDQRTARRDIARLLNLPPSSEVAATPVAVAQDWPLTLEESIVLAFQNRAELEQQLLQADISEQQRRIALAAIRPQVNLFANFGVDSVLAGGNAFTDDFQENSTIGAQFQMTLFDGGAARAQARQRELDGAIAEEQFSENQDQIRFDVEQAFFNLTSNKENIATSRIAVAQAEEALSLANLRLQAGVGTQLDVLTAQRELTEAESNNVTAILGYNRALAAMQRAISNLGLFELQ